MKTLTLIVAVVLSSQAFAWTYNQDLADFQNRQRIERIESENRIQVQQQYQQPICTYQMIYDPYTQQYVSRRICN